MTDCKFGSVDKSLCNLGGLCASVMKLYQRFVYHRVTKNAEVAQRNLTQVSFESYSLLLVFPLGNAAGSPGSAGCFHLFLEPRQIKLD